MFKLFRRFPVYLTVLIVFSESTRVFFNMKADDWIGFTGKCQILDLQDKS